ncbi:MAG: enoyl-CoA hydratase/isomerase family protein [Acidobacteria bacterium]|nr:enoyl-CoA hydratase/isomerase family protein [Acidobacteriota bacterium]
MTELTWQGDVAVITMDRGENRFDLAETQRWHALLDEVEAHEGPLALVTTGTDKFYSNGLDLDWLMANQPEAGHMLRELHRVWGRILGLDCITVAAVNGHCFGAGALLSSAHDRIVMRADRGFWCMPELDLGLPVSEKMAALLTARLPRTAIHEALMTARRYTAADGFSVGIVDEIAEADAVVSTAVTWAAAIAPKSREVIGEHKRILHGELVAALTGR